jgi:nucleoside-diphosphate-sugar epimerase
MKASVFGASGFVGSRLVEHLRAGGYEVRPILRGDATWRDEDLGHAFFCIGLTADFRKRSLETLDAHVCAATEALRRGRFDSFLYLSSTRVYSRAEVGREDSPITVDPTDPSDLYNLSKLTGEAACLAQARPEVRVARLSNVFGPGMDRANFLGSILADAAANRPVRLGQAADSAKDYVAIDDVVEALVRIAMDGTERLYNVASGIDTTHGELLAGLEALTGHAGDVAAHVPTVKFPAIEVSRLRALIDWRPVAVLDRLGELLAAARAGST